MNIFLINKKGDVTYTVFKELDYATDVIDAGHYLTQAHGDWFTINADNDVAQITSSDAAE